jgi:REP element-mobilizing transposase RayT
MARLARVIAVGVPHHITQRGNARRFILQDEPDRKVYLDLLRQSTELHGIALVGYCLMSNHVHLVAVPRKADVLARALGRHMAGLPPTGTHSTIRRGMFGRAGTIPALWIQQHQTNK